MTGSATPTAVPTKPEAPAAGDPTPPESTTPTTPPTPPVTPPPADPPAADEPFDRDRAMSTIRQQREAEKKLKSELAEAKEKAAKFDELEAGNLSDLERERKRANDLDAQLAANAGTMRAAKLTAALADPKFALVDPTTAAAVLRERGIEFDDDHAPKALDEAVEALLQDKPFLKAGTAPRPTPPPTDAGAGTGDQPGPSLTAEELDFAQRAGVDPDYYASIRKKMDGGTGLTQQEWEAVQKAKSAGQPQS